MHGWTYADVRALPGDVFDELVAMLREDAAESEREA